MTPRTIFLPMAALGVLALGLIVYGQWDTTGWPEFLAMGVGLVGRAYAGAWMWVDRDPLPPVRLLSLLDGSRRTFTTATIFLVGVGFARVGGM